MKGDVYFDKNFTYADGNIGEKLFIIVHYAKETNTALVVKTTSQKARYANVKDGCDDRKPVFYVPLTFKQKFTTDTYVQLDEIFEYSSAELMTGKFSGTINFKFKMDEQYINGIVNCIKKYKDFVEEKYHVIFKK